MLASRSSPGSRRESGLRFSRDGPAGRMLAVSTLPDGLVTLLFTDVEGSTRLAKGVGDPNRAELLEQHQRLPRPAFSAHGGWPPASSEQLALSPLCGVATQERPS